MHGHNYVALFTARCPTGLDQLGRVIDFSVLKERLGGWIDQNWDHGFIYWAEDIDMSAIFAPNPFKDQMKQHKSYALPHNPTAENMARYLLDVIAPELFRNTNIVISRVRLWETENCYADAALT
jgi:6-pyruvoyltetrahydropterin/6-carboxytetrahydropterin synthase